MLVCEESMISAIVAPALPMIIPGTTEGTRNFKKASSSGRRRKEGKGRKSIISIHIPVC